MSQQQNPYESREPSSAWVIDQAACTQCGICVRVCPEAVVALEDGRLVVTAPAACTFCGLCEELCPESAIALSYAIVWGKPGADSTGEHA
jgi:ferredoxin